jgi:hypothetical protein
VRATGSGCVEEVVVVGTVVVEVVGGAPEVVGGVVDGAPVVAGGAVVGEAVDAGAAPSPHPGRRAKAEVRSSAGMVSLGRRMRPSFSPDRAESALRLL